MNKKYDNYIFDLYETLVDIHTDEEKEILWQKMSEYLLNNFGAKYEPKELRKEYLRVCAEEEEGLRIRLESSSLFGSASKSSDLQPELRISWVWKRLIAEKTDIEYPELIHEHTLLPDKDIFEEVDENIQKLCTYFREESRDKLYKYTDVDATLKKLRASGKKIFLLSNAQRLFTLKELEDTGLTEYFDDIFISSDKLVRKPCGLFMEMLLDKNSLEKSKCVMIGNDPKSDGGVARNCGVNSIIVKNGDFSQIF